MSVRQTFLKIQSAAWLTVLLQASRSPPAQALPAEGALGRGRGRGRGVGVAVGTAKAVGG